MIRPLRVSGLAILAIVLSTALVPLTVGADTGGDWTQYLGSSSRTGYNAAETAITSTTADTLQLKWQAKAGSIISAQPVTSQGQVYWGSWDAYERSTSLSGSLNWQTYLGQSSDTCDGSLQYGVTDAPVTATISINGAPTPVLWLGGLCQRVRAER